MTLENLLRIQQLKAEPPDKREFTGLLRSAKARLADARRPALSPEGRFDLAYGAAHSVALAALRAKGYRTDKRYLAFQCLIHTLNCSPAKVRFFALCHDKRNLAEYEGHFEANEALFQELIDSVEELLEKVSHIEL